MSAPVSEPSEQLSEVSNFAEHTLGHLHNTINLADQKASFLFATVTAVLAYLHTSGATKPWLEALRGNGAWTFWTVVVSVAVLGLVGGAVGALWVVVPRARVGAKGLTASWAIAEYESPQQYAEQVRKTDLATLTQSRLEQIWALARISRRKYLVFGFAIRCSFVGLVAAILYLAFA